MDTEMNIVLNQFLACTPVYEISWILFDPDPTYQNLLFNKIFNHDVTRCYGPSRDYQLSFLKKWMTFVEKSNHSIIDQVYVLYAELIQQNPMKDFTYKSYYLDENIYVTLKESNHIITQGTTGLHSWQAAFYLSEWISMHKEKFYQKRILELGSGVGLLGLATLHFTSPASYIFTDCNSTVLEALQSNLDLNNTICDQGRVKVVELDWSSDNMPFPVDSLDFVFATDVIFDPVLIEHFVTCLMRIISKNSVVAIIASTIRNEDTYQQFLQQLKQHLLSYKVLDPVNNKIFHYDRSLKYSIIKIFK